MSRQNYTEEFSVNGDQVVEKVKQLIKEGNVRRVIIKNEKGESIMEFPVTAGVVGVLLLPTLAALSAAVVLMTRCTIAVERWD
ncbi:DUF4342 domain-containing protein [Candidatus Saccharibacteria bacterium oral taxon 488]|nr:DUF4342 domain-containing protein [Candidatus Saccharibacteria bacterium oral taxon 488]